MHVSLLPCNTFTIIDWTAPSWWGLCFTVVPSLLFLFIITESGLLSLSQLENVHHSSNGECLPHISGRNPPLLLWNSEDFHIRCMDLKMKGHQQKPTHIRTFLNRKWARLVCNAWKAPASVRASLGVISRVVFLCRSNQNVCPCLRPYEAVKNSSFSTVPTPSGRQPTLTCVDKGRKIYYRPPAHTHLCRHRDSFLI